MTTDARETEGYLPSADGAHVLHQLTRLQLERSAPLHFLVPQLDGSALFRPAGQMSRYRSNRLGPSATRATYGRSFPPVTMRPSLRVVYMVKTGPLWALATTRTRKCSLHTYTSPFTAPLKVSWFWRTNRSYVSGAGGQR